MEAPDTRTLNLVLDAPVPTHLYYGTIDVDDAGRLTRYRDIYGQDADALAGVDGIAILEAPTAATALPTLQGPQEEEVQGVTPSP